jgi:hypothetical protein
VSGFFWGLTGETGKLGSSVMLLLLTFYFLRLKAVGSYSFNKLAQDNVAFSLVLNADVVVFVG